MGEVWLLGLRGLTIPSPSSPLALEVGPLPSVLSLLLPFSRPLEVGPLPSVLSLLLPFSRPLEAGPLKSSYGSLGSAVSSPSGVWGAAPAELELGAFSFKM